MTKKIKKVLLAYSGGYNSTKALPLDECIYHSGEMK